MSRATFRMFLALLCGSGSLLFGQGNFKASLTGYDEVPTLSTASSGQVTVRISHNPDLLTVKLTFTKLEAVATAAHFHLGKPAINGGAVAFICGGPKPSCPATPDGTVTTTIAANDVIGAPAQGLVAGDLAGLIRAIENGAVYANLHSVKYPGGEIRGQLGRGNGNGNGNGKGKGKDKDKDDDE